MVVKPAGADSEADAGESGAGEGAADKGQAILAAATAAFLTGGYHAVSMDAIARAAGVSKQTIYNRFGCKEALFAAIIRRRCDDFLTPLRMPACKAEGAHAALVTLGRQFLSELLSEESLALYRALLAEMPRRPELGEVLHSAGPEVGVVQLATYLEQLTATGAFAFADPKLAAEQFFGMLNGHFHFRALFGIEPAPSPERLAQAVEEAVSVFLRGHAS